MEENSKNLTIAYTKNLNKFNFNTTITASIDANASIKTILDINTYIFDQKVECGNGKAIINGKFGMKVLYIDTDNMSNTITETTNFSQTFTDNAITSNTYLNISDAHISNNVLSTDGILKVNCDISISPIAYLNLGVSNAISSSEMLITKSNEIKTNSIACVVNTQFEHTTNIETKYPISKLLYNNSCFSVSNITAENEFAVVEGKIISTFLIETTENDENVIKEFKEVSHVKCDVEIKDLKKEDILDLSFNLDKSQDNSSIETEDGSNIILTKHTIKVCGVCLKEVSINVVDDAFSTTNEIETTKAVRECTKNTSTFTLSELISNEITLLKEETAIDDVIANLSIYPEVTNTYIKDGLIYLEGIVSSNLSYIDENKEYKLKTIEIPFIINTKIQAEVIHCAHNKIDVVDSKIKVKRGTIVELEYTLFISLTTFDKENYEMIDSFTMGKPLNFGDYDFQIFIAKQGETLWELCKRIKIAPNEINKLNKDLPLIMEGGEKVIIRR